MGGLLGILLASMPNTPVARLVVNDIGPAIEPTALSRIGGYIGQAPTFGSYAEIENYIREVSKPFGNLSDAQWAHLTDNNVRQRADGTWELAYDPAIAAPFKAAPVPPDLWSLWDRIRCPTLVLRGMLSDLLSAETAAQMASRGPRPCVVEFPDVGHAPMLLTQEQIDPVLRFLRS
jgi:pimeloyl-ACP methyl ester carboxylesterase